MKIRPYNFLFPFSVYYNDNTYKYKYLYNHFAEVHINIYDNTSSCFQKCEYNK